MTKQSGSGWKHVSNPTTRWNMEGQKLNPNNSRRPNVSNLITIFIDNLHLNMSFHHLRYFFEERTKNVKDVFIPSKLRPGKNYRYGFVRYRTIPEAQKAIKDCNGSFLWGNKIRVKMASRGLDHRPNLPINQLPKPIFPTDAPNHSSLSRLNTFPKPNIPPRPNTIPRPNLPLRGNKDSRSYRDAMCGMQKVEDPPAVSKNIVYEVNQGDWNWLEASAVGYIAEPRVIPQLLEKLDKNILKTCSIAPMGGNAVLISFSNKEGLISAMNSSKGDWLDDWFDLVEPWKPSIKPYSRLVWLKCSNVPLHAFSPRFFDLMGSLCGTPVAIDKDTLLRKRLDFGHILVLTTMKETISRSHNVLINGDMFTIHINEDFTKLVELNLDSSTLISKVLDCTINKSPESLAGKTTVECMQNWINTRAEVASPKGSSVAVSGAEAESHVSNSAVIETRRRKGKSLCTHDVEDEGIEALGEEVGCSSLQAIPHIVNPDPTIPVHNSNLPLSNNNIGPSLFPKPSSLSTTFRVLPTPFQTQLSFSAPICLPIQTHPGPSFSSCPQLLKPTLSTPSNIFFPSSSTPTSFVSEFGLPPSVPFSPPQPRRCMSSYPLPKSKKPFLPLKAMLGLSLTGKKVQTTYARTRKRKKSVLTDPISAGKSCFREELENLAIVPRNENHINSTDSIPNIDRRSEREAGKTWSMAKKKLGTNYKGPAQDVRGKFSKLESRDIQLWVGLRAP